MTLFTKTDCRLCDQLKNTFDLDAMGVAVEVLDDHDAGALAHLAWHGLVETARKTLPLLVLDDSSTVIDFQNIEAHLSSRARQYGVVANSLSSEDRICASGSCAL